MIAFNNASDRRLKKDVENLDDALETVVMNLRPVEFTWNDDIAYTARRGTRDVGFIAQEIHEVIPHTFLELGHIMNVNNSSEPIRGIRHERVIPYLVRAIQQLHERVQTLEQELNNTKM
jgi:hypothetical protein